MGVLLKVGASAQRSAPGRSAFEDAVTQVIDGALRLEQGQLHGALFARHGVGALETVLQHLAAFHRLADHARHPVLTIVLGCWAREIDCPAGL